MKEKTYLIFSFIFLFLSLLSGAVTILINISEHRAVGLPLLQLATGFTACFFGALGNKKLF